VEAARDGTAVVVALQSILLEDRQNSRQSRRNICSECFRSDMLNRVNEVTSPRKSTDGEVARIHVEFVTRLSYLFMYLFTLFARNDFEAIDDRSNHPSTRAGMSRRRLSLSPAQQTFLDIDFCQAISKSAEDEGLDDRPAKRRKLEPSADGWSSILEFVLEFHFEDEAPIAPSTSATDTKSSPIPAGLRFDDPVLSVSHSETDQALFAFICQEDEATTIDAIIWLRGLSQKDPSVAQCLRLSTAVSFQVSQGVIVGAEVSVGVQVRFDRSLLSVVKLSPKDRLAVLDYVFDGTPSEVHADQFYTNIGRLPDDDIVEVNGESLQHPSITCRLFPFQKRAVAWMLTREGKLIETTSNTLPTQASHSGGSDNDGLPALWETMMDLDGNLFYLNRHQAYLTHDKEWIQDFFGRQNLPGGILAEVSS
jgi:hypothetical protein